MPQLLSKQETADIIGVHPEHVMRMVRAGRFPKPIKTGPAVGCAVRFVADEVQQWIVGRMADREPRRAVPE